MAASTTSRARKQRTEELHELWRKYKASGDKRLRDRLVLTLAPLVKFIVYRKIREMPARVEAEDFISVGLEAMIQSIDRYDPEKGATLEQYAWTRIHGAVLDEMRRQDWAPRSVCGALGSSARPVLHSPCGVGDPQYGLGVATQRTTAGSS